MVYKQAVPTIFVQTFLKTSLQLNLQVSSFMIHRYLAGSSLPISWFDKLDNTDFHALFSIVLAACSSITFEIDLVVTCMKKTFFLMRHSNVERLTEGVRNQTASRISVAGDLQRDQGGLECPLCRQQKAAKDPMCGDCWDQHELISELGQVKTFSIRLLLIFLFSNSLIFYAVVKLYKSFACPESLWNFRGCADPLSVHRPHNCLSANSSASIA